MQHHECTSSASSLKSRMCGHSRYRAVAVSLTVPATTRYVSSLLVRLSGCFAQAALGRTSIIQARCFTDSHTHSCRGPTWPDLRSQELPTLLLPQHGTVLYYTGVNHSKSDQQSLLERDTPLHTCKAGACCPVPMSRLNGEHWPVLMAECGPFSVRARNLVQILIITLKHVAKFLVFPPITSTPSSCM